ncbi:glycosyl transferase [Cognatiyoonia sp.]|uniref:glycosyl transferase n=1 Tax=Cognatiyoonia sp. TaxID=2211652 RepID=UPI003F6A29C4
MDNKTGQCGSWTYETELTAGQPQVFNLQEFVSFSHGDILTADCGVLSCRIRSQETEKSLRIDRMAWATHDAPKRRPDLTLSVTTFKREESVLRAAKRFSDFRETSDLKQYLQMQIVDNGQSIPPDQQLEGVDVLHSPNLGGAGGFTRGFLEARDRGASHVLFMDDDASIQMETLERTWNFLAYACDDATAISGAMSTDQFPWALWEYGARFFKNCLPLHGGVDLRKWKNVVDIECSVAGAMPPHLYGGWWFFAFPVAQVDHLAFPFFVRGDDVSFSLVNCFEIVRLNGVVSYQESFIEKESPLTWYLDLRSHMAHHLSIKEMEIGPLALATIALKFFLKNIAKMHYSSVSAVNLAVEDVLQGPDFFAENIDMSERRAAIKAITREEAWIERDEKNTLGAIQTQPKPTVFRLLMKLTLNGHLIPGFKVFGAKQSVVGDNRGALGIYWGVSKMTVFSADKKKMYQVRHSKGRAFEEGVRLARNLFQLVCRYSDLKKEYQDKYPILTGEPFWREQFDQSIEVRDAASKKE